MSDTLERLRHIDRQIKTLQTRDLTTMGYEAKQQAQQRISSLQKEFQELITDATREGLDIDEFLATQPTS